MLNKYNKQGAYMIAKGPWVVAKVLTKNSQHGGYIYEITFISNRAEITHTYVDPANRNYKKWQEIIDLFDQGYGIILDDLRYKVVGGQQVYKRGTKEALINADSKVKQLFATPEKQVVIDQLAEVIM
jgi:hypothetical protein